MHSTLNFKKLLFFISGSFFLFILYGCLSEPTEGGNTSVIGQISDSQGKPVANTTIYLRTADYRAVPPELAKKGGGSKFDVISDSLGKFSIDSIEPGKYILSGNTLDNSEAFAMHLDLTETKEDDQGEIVLGKAVTLKGVFNAIYTNKKLYATVLGFEKFAYVDTANGTFEIPGMPNIKVNVAIQVYANPTPETILHHNISHSPIMYIPIPSVCNFFDSTLTGKRQYQIITTASGANTQETFENYPVLVRIPRSEPILQDIDPTGKGTIFTDGNGCPISFEIERWHQLGGAAIWVNLPIVKGNDTTKFYMERRVRNFEKFKLFGLNKVFTTPSTFIAVYHFNKKQGDTRPDASKNKIAAKTVNFPDSISNKGLIGRGDSLGGNNYLSSQEYNLDYQEFTFTAWVMPDKTDKGLTEPGVIFSQYSDLPNSANPQIVFQLEITSDQLLRAIVLINKQKFDTLTTSWPQNSPSRWKHIGYVATLQKITLFIDGIPVTSKKVHNYMSRTSKYMHIGHSELKNSINYKGIIDEVRLIQKDVPNEWIKLDFETQRRDNNTTVINASKEGTAK